MSILKGLQAFFEALDGGRTTGGQPPAASVPTPAQPPAPLVELVGVLSAKVVALEAGQEGLKGLIKEETDRAIRASEASRRAVQRAVQRLEGSDEQPDPDDDVPEGHAPGRIYEPMQPMRGAVESPQLQPSPAEIREAARRALNGLN